MIQGSIYLDNFTKNNVDLRMQDNPVWRKNYVNSVEDRRAVQEEVPEPYRTAIFAVWGDTPTVDKSID